MGVEDFSVGQRLAVELLVCLGIGRDRGATDIETPEHTA